MNNDLYAYAEKQGVKVLSFSLPNCESISLMNNDNCYIGIDDKQLESSMDERVHIAHELGHCETGAFYNEYSPLSIREKCEATADRWAVKKLINKDEFNELIKSGIAVWELAEHFNVTEDFIKKAYHLYFEVKISM